MLFVKMKKDFPIVVPHLLMYRLLTKYHTTRVYYHIFNKSPTNLVGNSKIPEFRIPESGQTGKIRTIEKLHTQT